MTRYWWILALVLLCAGCGTRHLRGQDLMDVVVDDVVEAMEMYEPAEVAGIAGWEMYWSEPFYIDLEAADLMSVTGMDVQHTMQSQTYYAMPGETSWAKIHFSGWEPPPPKHAMEERIPLLGPEGNPNVILMKFNDGEYETAYIAKEAVREVVRQVLAEEDLPPLRVVVGGTQWGAK